MRSHSPATPAQSAPSVLPETAMMSLPSGPVNVDCASPIPDSERVVLERYDRRALLGEGGMGSVYLCRDRVIGRDVAMKVLRSNPGPGSQAVARFEREARIQGQLEHPSVVPVYDLGVDPDGATYFTMKRVRGVTLAQVLQGLREGSPDVVATFTLHKLLTLFGQVCLAIAFAHARGVLHRDLKPANVMLGDFGEVHLLDWGIAKLGSVADVAEDEIVDAPTDEGPTVPGVVMGTPGYMAPEQLTCRAIDCRADVWALGALLFELLTLEPLVPQGRLDDVVAFTTSGVDARASVRAPAREIAPELDEICTRATAVDAEQRYASARELYEAIDRFLEGDRDVERRKRLADAHAQAAEEAVTRAMATGGEAERARAMREVSAALALQPGHASAMATLLKLLVEVPATMPADARIEFEAKHRRTMHLAHRLLPLAYAGWLAVTASAAFLGIRSWLAYGIACGAQLGCVVLSWIMARRREPGIERPILYGLTAVGLASIGTFLGPLVTIPGIAGILMGAYVAFGERRHRAYLILLAGLSVLVPFALEVVGLVTPSYAFEGGRLVIASKMTYMPAGPTLAYWLVSGFALAILPPVLLSLARDTFSAAEARLFLHAWQLRQFLPAAVPTSNPP